MNMFLWKYRNNGSSDCRFLQFVLLCYKKNIILLVFPVLVFLQWEDLVFVSVFTFFDGTAADEQHVAKYKRRAIGQRRNGPGGSLQCHTKQPRSDFYNDKKLDFSIFNSLFHLAEVCWDKMKHFDWFCLKKISVS